LVVHWFWQKKLFEIHFVRFFSTNASGHPEEAMDAKVPKYVRGSRQTRPHISLKSTALLYLGQIRSLDSRAENIPLDHGARARSR
jgi:hypothetical protein